MVAISAKLIFSMPPLQVSFFGGFHLSHNTLGELVFSHRKVMGLLAFLAIESGQAHSRESLMGLLWPDLPEADARNNLRVTLARLRAELEKAGVTPSPLVATRHAVQSAG